MDSQQLTQERYHKQAERTAKDAGWGDTPGALGISGRYLDVATQLVEAGKQYLRPREHRDILEKLPAELIALCGLTAAINAVVAESTLASLCLQVGTALETECYGFGLKTWDADRHDQIVSRVLRDHRMVDMRRTAMRQLARKAKFPWSNWSAHEKAYAGRWLVEILLESPVLMLDDEGRPTLTVEAMEVADRIVADLQERHPVLLPLKEPPEPWDRSETTIHGYRVSLVRSRDGLVQKTTRAAIRDGRMAASLEALNAAQSVPYRVNQGILEVVKWCYANGINVKGLPPKDDLELPRGEPGIKDHPEKFKAHLKARRDLRMLNRSYLGERLAFHQDMATADHLKDGPFWTPMSFDYRGRVYGVPRFNFQRQDYVRALFEFEHGEDITDTGLYWLKVHVANCGDFGKISKRPFDERVQWVDNRVIDLVMYADYPQESLGWTEADKPFLFLAGCMALRDAVCGCFVRLPIAFDGSCSGLQHLGAMTRDEQTCELVNLTAGQKPNDVYQVVADMAASQIRLDSCDTDGVLVQTAQSCLDYGVDRSLVKRNVMTFSYSSKAFGMSEQHMEDTMVPLQYDVLAGKIPVHPFGEDGGLAASRYLSKVVYRAIEATVKRPAEAMGYLQSIARVLAHDGLPVVWHTPLGFPVVMRYVNSTSTQVKLLLHDKGVRRTVKPRILVDQHGIDKRRATSAIAPSFVHSLDAAHLMLVVLNAKDAGITNVSLVHDSFGCLPNGAGRFREIIKQSFHDLYEQTDVLFDVLRESAGQLKAGWHRLPNLPPKGGYEMKSIMEADYAFA